MDHLNLVHRIASISDENSSLSTLSNDLGAARVRLLGDLVDVRKRMESTESELLKSIHMENSKFSQVAQLLAKQNEVFRSEILQSAASNESRLCDVNKEVESIRKSVDSLDKNPVDTARRLLKPDLDSLAVEIERRCHELDGQIQSVAKCCEESITMQGKEFGVLANDLRSELVDLVSGKTLELQSRVSAVELSGESEKKSLDSLGSALAANTTRVLEMHDVVTKFASCFKSVEQDVDHFEDTLALHTPRGSENAHCLGSVQQPEYSLREVLEAAAGQDDFVSDGSPFVSGGLSGSGKRYALELSVRNPVLIASVLSSQETEYDPLGPLGSTDISASSSNAGLVQLISDCGRTSVYCSLRLRAGLCASVAIGSGAFLEDAHVNFSKSDSAKRVSSGWGSRRVDSEATNWIRLGIKSVQVSQAAETQRRYGNPHQESNTEHSPSGDVVCVYESYSAGRFLLQFLDEQRISANDETCSAIVMNLRLSLSFTREKSEHGMEGGKTKCMGVLERATSLLDRFYQPDILQAGGPSGVVGGMDEGSGSWDPDLPPRESLFVGLNGADLRLRSDPPIPEDYASKEPLGATRDAMLGDDASVPSALYYPSVPTIDWKSMVLAFASQVIDSESDQSGIELNLGSSETSTTGRDFFSTIDSVITNRLAKMEQARSDRLAAEALALENLAALNEDQFVSNPDHVSSPCRVHGVPGKTIGPPGAFRDELHDADITPSRRSWAIFGHESNDESKPALIDPLPMADLSSVADESDGQKAYSTCNPFLS